MDHGTYRQLAAGAVLDDLDQAEMVALDVHRATCHDCRDLLDGLGGVAFDLALAAPQRRPPPALRDAVLASVRAPARSLAPTLPTPLPGLAASEVAAPLDRPSTIADLQREARRLRVVSFGGLAAAAVLAIMVIGLGVRSAQLSDDVATARADMATARGDIASQNVTMSGAMAVALDPSHVTASLHAEPVAPTASAVVVYRPGTADAYLMVTGLPATPAGAVYQLWVADAAGLHALGTFDFDGRGAFVAPFAHDLGDASAAMVTIEPAGGSVGAPGPQVVFGEL